MALQGYPKTEKLKNGKSVTLRPMVAEDRDKLLAFWRQVPLEDRLFLKEDVTRPEVVQRWVTELNYDKVLPILAELDGQVIGDGTLHIPAWGWRKHMAEVRVVVSREFRRQGLGKILLRALVDHAIQHGLEKLEAQFMSHQKEAMAAFGAIGFRQVAELEGFVRDIQNKPRTLVIMVHNVQDLWRMMEDLYADMAHGEDRTRA